MKSECEKLTLSIVDLVYGELSEAEAEQFRAHAAKCTECREQIESLLLTRKLVARIPEPPPLSIDEAALFQRAREEAVLPLENSTNIDANQGTGNLSIERKPSLAMRLRRFLLTPALATTAAAFIVFAVSYFILEQGNPSLGIAENELSVPVSTHSAEPSVFPADKEIGSGSKKASLPSTHEPVPAELARIKPSYPQKQHADRWKPATQNPKRSRSGTAADARTGNNLGTAAHAAQKQESSPPKSASEKSKLKTPAVSRKSASRMQPTRNNLEEIELDEKYHAPQSPGQLASSSNRDVESPSVKDLKDADSLYEKGLSAYLRGDCKTAIKNFDELQRTRGISSQKRMIALHHLGRCEKRRGSCGKALVWYDQLLSSYRSYTQRSAALWESAACHRKLGRIERARRLLIELSNDTAWKSRALGELEKINGYSKLD